MSSYRLAAMMAACAVVCGACSGVTPGQVVSANYGASAGSLGTVVFAINRRGTVCPKPSVIFGRLEGAEFVKAGYAEMGNTMFGYEHAKAITMPPGEYHVVQVSCIDGRFISSLGKPKVEQLIGPLKTQSDKFERSFGSFKIERAGEVVNIGFIEMNQSGLFDGGPPLSVKDLPPAAMTQLQSTNADLVNKMVSRPLVLSPMLNVSELLAKAAQSAQAKKN
jgi:hypothetical protein